MKREIHAYSGSEFAGVLAMSVIKLVEEKLKGLFQQGSSGTIKFSL